jgi:hypothetical protein
MLIIAQVDGIEAFDQFRPILTNTIQDVDGYYLFLILLSIVVRLRNVRFN